MFKAKQQVKNPWVYTPTLEEKEGEATNRMIAAEIVRRAGKRDVVFWGADPALQQVLEEEYETPVKGIYGRLANAPSGNIEQLSGLHDKFFLVVPHLSFDKNLGSRLEQMGYEMGKDCLFRLHKAAVVPVKDGYRDCWGNEIHGTLEGAKVVFRGFGCRVEIGEGCKGGAAVIEFRKSGAVFRMGNQVSVTGACRFVGMSSCAEITLGDQVSMLEECVFAASFCSKIRIGELTRMAKKINMTAHSYTEIIIEKKGLLAAEIALMAGDGHSIIDLNTGESINNQFSKMPDSRRRVHVGEHVWIGRRAFLMGGADVGNGCMIGAMSLVKKRFPNNCVIAGNPAKVIRKNITWDRAGNAYSLEKCDPDYICETVELEP